VALFALAMGIPPLRVRKFLGFWIARFSRVAAAKSVRHAPKKNPDADYAGVSSVLPH